VAGLVEHRDPGSEQQRNEVDVYLVEKPGVEALPDGVAAVNAHRAFAGGCGRSGHRALEPVGNEMYGRAGPGPSLRHVVSEDECRNSPPVLTAPAFGLFEGTAAREH